MKKQVILAAMLSFALVGCGLSPQQITPAPRIQADFARVAQGQAVQVRVVDGRSTDVVGSRGGAYPNTSLIRVDGQRLLPRLQAETDVALRAQGFNPGVQVHQGAQLLLTLKELSYKVPASSGVGSKANVSATFQVDVENRGRRYSGRYAASMSQGFATAPSAAANEKLLSEVLSDALQRVFKDQAVSRLLAE